MKAVEVEYIEKGTFCGGEEDAFNADIKPGQTCYVLTEAQWQQIKDLLQ